MKQYLALFAATFVGFMFVGPLALIIGAGYWFFAMRDSASSNSK